MATKKGDTIIRFKKASSLNEKSLKNYTASATPAGATPNLRTKNKKKKS